MTSEMDQDNDDYMPRSASPAMSRSPEPDRRDKRESDTPSSPAKRGRSDSASQRKVRSPPRPSHAPDNPDPTTIVGVFGLSVRTTERDLEDEFGRVAPVAKVVIVFDARTQRSRGFGFVTMEDIEGASAAIKALNGIELHGRRIRVDFSVTNKAHDPTPGEYRGEARREDRPGGAGGRYPPPPRGWGPPPPWMDPRGPPPPYAYGPPPGRGGYYPPPPPPSNGGGWGRGPPGGGGWSGRGGDRDRRGDRERGGGYRDDRDRRRGGPDDDNWRRRDRSRSPTRRRDRSYSRSPPPRRSRGGDAEEPSRRRDD